LLLLAIFLMQHVPEARADVSAPDKEVFEAVKKVAPAAGIWIPKATPTTTDHYPRYRRKQ
jgi:hypothetical protein